MTTQISGTFHAEAARAAKRTHDTSSAFRDLGLSQPLVRALAVEGYETPTPIQQQAIPHVLAGRDLLGCAQTGTGKTAAFALPILHRLEAGGSARTGRRRPRVLVLAPTRELAIQIDDSFRAYGRFAGLRATAIFGGVGQQPQVRALDQGVDVLIATPGRLLDLMGQRLVDLSAIEVFVLDEADRMLDMGFIHDVRRIAGDVPARRQTLLFSATMPKEIRQLADAMLTDPVEVQVAPVSARAERIEQSVYFVEKAAKAALLCRLLDEAPITRALVFTRTKHGADRLARQLHRSGVRAEAIHGNKSQGARQRAMANFRSTTTSVLVATDIAARGLDIDDVSHVFNYDLPNEPETYIHRIGRTGRAGASGVAISFCDVEERAYLFAIEKLIREPIPVLRDAKQPVSAEASAHSVRLAPAPPTHGDPSSPYASKDPRPRFAGRPRSGSTARARGDIRRGE